MARGGTADPMARDKHTIITQSLHGKEVYWERKEGREKKTDSDLLPQRHRRKRMGGACLLKEPLHLYRVRALPAMRAGVATLPLPDPKGTGTGLCLPG